MIDPQTTLYRLYSEQGQLLYCGIAQSWIRRFSQHAHDKTWWSQVASMRLEQLPTREDALEAERRAIISEGPLHNVVHNRSRKNADELVGAGRSVAGPRQWTFRSRLSGFARTCPLWLYPELDGSSVVDDAYSEDEESQLLYYISYLERNHPEWLKDDAVPIYWYVQGEQTFEAAPFDKSAVKLWKEIEERSPRTDHIPHQDFLSYFDWPFDQDREENLDWFRLPVVMERFPALTRALGWRPSPLQPTAPLASIMRSRNGRYPPDQAFDRRLSR